MKSPSNSRKFILPAAWLVTAAAAFSFGRMTSWLDAPAVQPGTQVGNPGQAASTGGASSGGLREGSDRVGAVFSSEAVTKRAGTVAEVTGGQPLEDWLKKVMSQEDDLFRMQQFMRLLETIDNVDDIKTALKAMAASRGGGGGRGPFGSRMTEFGMLMAKFTQMDPKAAMAFANEQEGGEKFAATFTALRTWTRMAPDAALAWAQTEGANLQMDFGRDRGGERDPNEPQANFALIGVLSQLARTDLDKALNVAATTEFGEVGGRAVDGLASELVSQRGAEGAKQVASAMADGSFKNQMIQQLANRLSREDPKSTADWVMANSSGDTRRRALGEVVDNWAEKDAAGAGAFLAAQQPGPEMDSAISEYARNISRQEPAKAWEWAMAIQDPERKTRAVSDVARDWIRADAASAKAAIATSPLPDDVKQRLSQPQQQGGGDRGGFRGGPGGGGPGGGPRGR